MPYRILDDDSSGSVPRDGFEVRRQRVIDALTEAYASDLITMDEYERRTSAAAAATRAGKLENLIADLPVGSLSPQPGPGGSRRSAPEARPPSGTYRDGPFTVACIMGDRSLTGNWLESDRVNSFTLMGSTRLDLRDVDLPDSGCVRIEAFVLMGETVVVVPSDMPVILTAVPVMGEARARREVNQGTRHARRWVEVSGLVIMGSLVVKAAD